MSFKLAGIMLAAYLCCGASAAISQAAAKCEKPFSALGDICFDYATAQVTRPYDPKQVLKFSDSDCSRGYAILVNALCFNRVTGDIEIAHSRDARTDR